MAASSLENEIKLRISNVGTARRLLRENGFRVSRRRVFERNIVFDSESQGLRNSGRLLRLREAGDRAVITFKGPAIAGKHKSREERETSIGSLPEFQIILQRLGFTPSFVYEKYRTEFSQPDRRGPDRLGMVTLDETPIGEFLEVEGPPAWVDRIARKLGYVEADYITLSYGALYLDFRERNGKRSRDMIFGRGR